MHKTGTLLQNEGGGGTNSPIICIENRLLFDIYIQKTFVILDSRTNCYKPKKCNFLMSRSKKKSRPYKNNVNLDFHSFKYPVNCFITLILKKHLRNNIRTRYTTCSMPKKPCTKHTKPNYVLFPALSRDTIQSDKKV